MNWAETDGQEAAQHRTSNMIGASEVASEWKYKVGFSNKVN